MSHLKYFNYPGWGDAMADTYSQAVRVGDRIECSGQGGWDPTAGAGTLTSDTPAAAQIEQAFKNVDIALRHAGASKGWKQVFRVTSYHIPLNAEVLEKMKVEYQKWMPEHKPIWTAVEVPRLGGEGMKVEIEVAAHVGQ